MAKEAVNISGEDTDDEAEETTRRKGSRVKQTIQKPKRPSEANNITLIFEALKTARNRNVITAEEFKEFNDIFQPFLKAKGNEKPKLFEKAKSVYKKLYIYISKVEKEL